MKEYTHDEVVDEVVRAAQQARESLRAGHTNLGVVYSQMMDGIDNEIAQGWAFEVLKDGGVSDRVYEPEFRESISKWLMNFCWCNSNLNIGDGPHPCPVHREFSEEERQQYWKERY
jgi:hypothetical protein